MSITPENHGFFLKLVWIMGYYRFMGFGCKIHIHQLGGLKSYGFSQVMGYHKYGVLQVWLYSAIVFNTTTMTQQLVFRSTVAATRKNWPCNRTATGFFAIASSSFHSPGLGPVLVFPYQEKKKPTATDLQSVFFLFCVQQNIMNFYFIFISVHVIYK